MSTKYEEIRAASKTWLERVNRAQMSLFDLVTGFVSYCGIPQQLIDRGRAVFDDEKGHWKMPVRILLDGSSIVIVFRVTEQNGKVAVSVHEGDAPTLINPDDSTECAKLFDGIVADIKDSFRESKTSRIGFRSESKA